MSDIQNRTSPLGPISYVPITQHNVSLDLVPPIVRAQISPQPCPKKTLQGDCWVWTGFKFKGYGRLSLKGFTTEKAHRILYEFFKGPIPKGLETDHLCLNPSCVNPDHLEPVTRAENIRRSHTTGNGNGTRTHCRRGHELTDENTYAWRGKRFCRDCQSLRDQAWRRRREVTADPFQGKRELPAPSPRRPRAKRSQANRGGAQ